MIAAPSVLELHEDGTRTGFEIEPADEDETFPPLGPEEWADLDNLVMLSETGVSISPSDRPPLRRGSDREDMPARGRPA